MGIGSVSRRDFLVALGGGVVLGGNASFSKAALQAPRVRKSIQSLTPDELTKFENAVAAMKARANSSVASWYFQARIHGYRPGEEPVVYQTWGTCQHGNWWFLPWHRVYLLYFESMLRLASNDPTVSLPYWDWTDPQQRALPAPFLNPNSTLFEQVRNNAINAGGQLSASAVRWQEALALDPFTTTNIDDGFGGRAVAAPGQEIRPHTGIESLSHDNIHDQIGGWMGDPSTAGRDPIFWLHHANIDRLWGEWLKTQMHANPTENAWLDQPFSFYGPQATLGSVTPRILSTDPRFAVSYDTDANPPIGLLAAAASEPPRRGATKAAGTSPMPHQAPKPRQLVASAPSPNLELGLEPVSVSLPVPAPKKQAMGLTAAGATPRKTFVSLEDVRFDPSPGRFYEIYLDLPKPEAATGPDSPYFAGTISFFALSHQHAAPAHAASPNMGTTALVDVTKAVDRLRRQGLLAGEDLKVTLVPQTPVVKNQAALNAPKPIPRVTIGGIKLLQE